jgi:tetratricopeptide (TPR) repeat protein
LELTTLPQAISAYQDAVDSLTQPPAADTSHKIMKLLLARDKLARVLADGQPVSIPVVTRVTALDQELREAAIKIDALVGRKTLANWRQSIHPLNSPWWWCLDERAAAAEKPNPLWAIPAAILFTLSISVLAETITTLRNGGINAVSVFGTLSQTLLALLAGSAFLSAGREWLENLFSQMKLNLKFSGKWRVILGLVVLGFTFGIRAYLPDKVARFRNYQGNQSLQDKQYFSAVQEYQQAVALKPDYKEAQYSLAVAYDKSHDYTKAISQYELAINSNPKNYTAYNNLARIYILRGDYDRAQRNLDFLRNSFADLRLDERYHFYKNSGWVDLELKNYKQAGEEFEFALRQRNGAAAHFLWGRVLAEQPGSKEERKANWQKAEEQWESFIQAVQNNPEQEEVEPNWKAYAQEQRTRGVENEQNTDQ